MCHGPLSESGEASEKFIEVRKIEIVRFSEVNIFGVQMS